MNERISKEEQEVLDSIDLDNVELEQPVELDMSEVDDNRPKMTDLNWTDFVMSLLDESEIVQGNPKADGLRRLVPILLGPIYHSESKLVHFDDKTTVAQHTVTIGFQDHVRLGEEFEFQRRTFSDIACVNDKNTPEKFLNHPVESAASKAEGRALRKALNLKKLAAEELTHEEKVVKEVVTNPDEQKLAEINTEKKIDSSQIAAINIMGARLGIDFNKYLSFKNLKYDTLTVRNGQDTLEEFSNWQRNKDSIPGEIRK